MNTIVHHKTFGNGNVICINSEHIMIRFGTQEKWFQFPQAFGSFLETDDLALLEMISARKEKIMKSALIIESNHNKVMIAV